MTHQYVYHFHAIKQSDVGVVMHMDGLLIRTAPVLNGDEYQSAKLAIAKVNGYTDSSGVVVCDLSLLHTTDVDT